jgi:hypothetical protein
MNRKYYTGSPKYRPSMDALDSTNSNLYGSGIFDTYTSEFKQKQNQNIVIKKNDHNK